MHSSEIKTVRHRRSGALLALALLVSAAAATPSAAGAEVCPNEALRAESGSTALPDCRAYEMVSPPDKNGGEVMPDATRVRASVSGDAVDFASLTPFGDAAGSGIAGEYVSVRRGEPGTSGWSTHSIIPQVAPVSFQALVFGEETYYQGEFSDDLSQAVLQSYDALTPAPNVKEVANVYLRPDVLASGNGSYTLMSACPGCSAPLSDEFGFYRPTVAGATPDLGHVIFEATRQLTADAPPENFFCVKTGLGCTPNLYEWDHGELRFAGILPDGSAAPESQAGDGAAVLGLATPNTISEDGSKIFFTVPAAGGAGGDLYMRTNHTTTVKLNASERTDCADHDPCAGTPEPDPNGPRPATYQIASADGSKVFFTSAEELTDTPGGDLYVYDTTLPVSDPDHLRHVFVDQQASTIGVLGTSRDGSYLYSLTQSAIAPGQPPLPAAAPLGLYVWHDGAVAPVGSVDNFAAVSDTLPKSAIVPLGARVSPDGKTLLFVAYSGAGLTGYDHGNTCHSVSLSGEGPCPELYLYKADTGTVRCVSCDPSGAPATSPAEFRVHTGTGAAAATSHLNHPLTADGDHVFFETGERLLPADKDGHATDVYEWTAAGAGGCGPSSPGYTAASMGCLALITPGTGPDDSHFLDASPSGHDVFFTTSQRLVGWDTDTSGDLYDARVAGGFPEPPPSVPECAGEACQGAAPPAPAAQGSPASTSPSPGEPAVAPAKHAAVTPPTKAQRLARALRRCRAKHRRSLRRKCESSARKRFGGAR